MILELAAGSLLVADFVYHRWWGDQPKASANFADSIDVPQTEEGTPVGYIYGKVRVTRPILAWMSAPVAHAGSGTTAGKTEYSASMFFVIGMPFCGGDSTNRIHRLWQGDIAYSTSGTGTTWTGYANPPGTLEQLDGNSEAEDINRHLAFVSFITKTVDGDVTAYSAGAVEFLNGNPNQMMVDDTGPYAVHNRAASRMSYGGVDRGEIPGYRGVMSMCLYRLDPPVDPDPAPIVAGFKYGITPQLGAISVEASSYKTDGGYPATGIMGRIGEDSNPINVAYDILTDSRKLGISPTYIDAESWGDAAATCYREDLGFSTCFDQRMPARDMLQEIWRHVDGMMFEDRKSGKLKVKLIRPDYDYATLPHITQANCKELQNLAIGGLSDVTNKLRVIYKDRSLGYIDSSAIAQNPANAAGQDGIEREEVRTYRGCTYAAQASALAARDLAALSRSIIKCRAMVFGEFSDIEPGTAVRLTWNKPDISGLVFRVAGPAYFGKLTDGLIGLDLIQDFNYQYRAFPPQPPIDHPDIGKGIKLGLGMR